MIRHSRTTLYFTGAAALAATVAIWAGCTRKLQTEIVVGVDTQMRVPQDIQTVRLLVNSGGSILFDQQYPVYDGQVRLPKTLGLVPQTGQPSVTMTVLGYVIPSNPLAFPMDGDPTNPPPDILRRAITQYIDSNIVYLPMALSYSCYGVTTCSSIQTCVAGQCVDATVDSTKLAPYADDLVFGNSSTCFSTTNCFPAEEPPIVVDEANCVYALPGTASAPVSDAGMIPLPPAPGSGVNVRVRYENLESEVLNLDPNEGFFIPDPTKPQQFKLAPGLCTLFTVPPDPKKRPRAILSIGVTGLCPSKVVNQPICTGDYLATEQPDGAPPKAFHYEELKPTKSALSILMDQSPSMSPFYGQRAFEQVLSFTLNDPVFQSIDVAFNFFPTQTCGGLVPAAGTSGFESASAVQAHIANALLMGSANGGSSLGANVALQSADTALNNLSPTAYDRLAVLFVTNNDLTAGTCNMGMVMPLMNASTYIVLLARQNDAGPSVNASNLQPIITGPTGQLFDLAASAANGPADFNQVAADLGSCHYEEPSDGALTPDDSITYVDPISLQPVVIAAAPPNMDCSSANATGSGWSPGTTPNQSKIIALCKTDCDNLHAAMKNRGLLAELERQLPPPLPLYVQRPGSGNDQ